MTAPPEAASQRWAPSLDQLIAATFGLLGVRLGARAIGDNSAFTHLRTGIDMVHHGLIPAIPRRDPYSFTAFHHPWTVQSWLAEFAMGWANRLGGHGAVIALAAIAMGALAWLIGTMARTGRPLTTAVAGFAAVAVGLPFWTPRPLLAGLLCLAATILIVQHRRAPWLLVPVVWIWVNAHGSFPLGLAWVGATCVGAWIDRRTDDDAETPPWRYIGWFIIGLVLACVNPLGPRLLTFAFSAFTKSEVFRDVIEWRSVNFQSAEGVVCLAGLVTAFAVLTRRRLPWRLMLPVIGFVLLGLYAQRNMAPLGVVLAPALACALRPSGGPSSPRAEVAAVNRMFGVVLVLAATVFLVGGVVGPPLAVADYPVRSIRWAERHGRFDQPHRVATRDTVGNYLELRRGARGDVFVDDRVDMFPIKVSDDYSAMLAGGDKGVRALDRWKIDTVLWSTPSAFVDRLQAGGGWAMAFREAGWIVLERK